MKTIAIIPAYNEASTIGAVLDELQGRVSAVVVVDDGSRDRTGETARSRGAIVLRHAINRGLGAALGTGFEAARRLGADAAVTLDADAQHDPSEIPKFLKALEEGAEVVIGSRLINAEGMPWHRIVANWLGNIATLALFGAWVTDSQSGYRAFSRKALEAMDLKANRMEISSEIIAEAKARRLRLVEVPVKAIYTDYSLSKGQGFLVGLKTLLKLVVRRLGD